MKLCLVTNSDVHHQYWIQVLGKHHHICKLVIVNPKPIEGKLLKGLKSKGVIWLMLKLASILYNILTRSKSNHRKIDAQKKYFVDYTNEIESKYSTNLSRCETINSDSVISDINAADPDLICFLGGDIAKERFINGCKAIILNFHSGISPIYNGSLTTYHAICNNQLNFCGGTLMILNERIDGGNILAHFFTSIERGDDEHTLFYKGIVGATQLYLKFIDHLVKHNEYFSTEQQRSFHYYRSNDWIISNDINMRLNLRSGNLDKRLIESSIEIYYDKPYTIGDIYAKVLEKRLR